MHSINFTENNKKICLSLRYIGTNSYLFVNGRKNHKFKANDSEIVATPLCLEYISKYWWVYNFSVDNDAILVADILDIHKYLMKKNNMI